MFPIIYQVDVEISGGSTVSFDTNGRVHSHESVFW